MLCCDWSGDYLVELATLGKAPWYFNLRLRLLRYQVFQRLNIFTLTLTDLFKIMLKDIRYFSHQHFSKLDSECRFRSYITETLKVIIFTLILTILVSQIKFGQVWFTRHSNYFPSQFWGNTNVYLGSGAQQ